MAIGRMQRDAARDRGARVRGPRSGAAWIRASLLIAAAGCLAAGSTHAQCLPDPAAPGDTVSCTGDLNAGYTVAPGVDDVTVTVESGASITSLGDGVGVNDASVVENLGTLRVNGVGSAAIRAGADATVRSSGVIDVAADQAFGVVTGSNARIDLSGTVDVSGSQSRGVAAGVGTTATSGALVAVDGVGAAGLAAADAATSADRVVLRNLAAGSIVTTGASAVGLQGGTFSSLINSGSIRVQGDGGAALRGGLEGQAINSGAIVVDAPGAVGIEALPFDEAGAPFGFANVYNARDPSASAGSIVSTHPDAGPLVRLLDGGSRIHQLFNESGAVLRADLTNLGMAGRAIAIQGSSGDDRIVNAGTIEGRIELGAGDDTYEQSATALFAEIGAGQLDGGGGTDEAVLTADRPELGRFAVETLQGFESLRVEGLWAVGGTSSAGLDLTVDPGGTLRLEGPLTIDGDFTAVAPGAGEARPGVQAVLGGSTAGAPALLHVTGTAAVAEAALDVQVRGGFNGATSVTIVRADTDLTGQFATVQLPTDPGLVFGPLVYDAVADTLSLSVFAAPYTPNAAATADYLARLRAAGVSADLQTVLDGLDTLDYTTYGLAMNQLHPEAYDAHTATTLELAHEYTELMLERPRHCIAPRGARTFDPRTGLVCRERRLEPWVAVYGQLGDRDGERGFVSYDDQGAGMVLGLDFRPSEHWLLGASAGGAYATIDVDFIGRGRLETIDLGLYAGYRRGPIRVQGVVGYGHGWQNRFRNLRLPGFARTADAAWNTDRAGVRVDAEYAFERGAWTLAPMASVDYTALLQDAFSETGARPVALEVGSRTDHVVTVRAGLELGGTLRKSGYWTELLEHADGVWRPVLSVRWRQVVTGAERDVSARFVDDSAAAAGLLTVTGDAPEMGFEVGAGVDWTPKVADRLTLGVHYDLFAWSGVTRHDLVGRVRLSF